MRENRLRRSGEESGFALILALACLIVLGISVTAVIDYTASGSRAASRSSNRQSAFSLAEAGIQNAYGVLNRWDPSTNSGNNATDATLLGCNSAGTSCTPIVSTFANGTATWYGIYNSTTSTWTITSTGSVSNQGTTTFSTKTLTATVHITWNNTQPSNATAWNYALSTGSGATCDVTLSNSVAINAPLYVAGNLCFANSSAVSEGADSINMEVLGDLHWLNGATGGIGTPNPITSLKVGGQCINGTNGTRHVCVIKPTSGADSIWVKSGGYSTTTVPITVPSATFSTYYNTANPGPKNACQTYTDSPVNSPTNAPTFDNDTALNLTYTGSGVNGSAYSTGSPFNLTPSSTDYNCIGKDPNDGRIVGQLKWDHTNRVLTVKGVIYIDGSATISNSGLVTYNGSATLYLTGVLTIPGTKFCASVSGTDCDFTGWDPNAEMFIVVANGSDNTADPTNSNSITMGQSSHFQGGLFATNNINLGNSSQADGPMIAHAILPGNSVVLKPLPVINTLPLGAPGNPNVHAQPGPILYQGG